MPRMSGSSGMPKPSPTAAIEAAVEAAVGALPGVSAAAAAAPPLPAGWATQLSRSTGRTYYVHVATGRTQYELPGGEDLDSIRGADDSGADVTGGEGVGTAVSPTAVDRQWLGSEQPPPPSLQLPPGWTSQISRSTGDTYYVHTETGHSQYEWPSDELGAPGGQTASEPPQPEPEPDLAPREGATPAPTSSAPSAVPGEGTPAVDDGEEEGGEEPQDEGAAGRGGGGAGGAWRRGLGSRLKRAGHKASGKLADGMAERGVDVARLASGVSTASQGAIRQAMQAGAGARPSAADQAAAQEAHSAAMEQLMDKCAALQEELSTARTELREAARVEAAGGREADLEEQLGVARRAAEVAGVEVGVVREEVRRLLRDVIVTISTLWID
jgi:hypothetical protein